MEWYVDEGWRGWVEAEAVEMKFVGPALAEAVDE